MLKQSYIIAMLISLGVVFSGYSFAYAQLSSSFQSVKDIQQENGVKTEINDIGDVILGITKVISYLGIIISAVVIVWGGIHYIISIGDDTKIATAKHTIMYAVIGLIAVGLAGLLVNVVVNLFAAN